MKEHNLREDGSWGLIMDELAELTGKIKEAITKSLDSEYGLSLEVLFTTFCQIFTHILAKGYEVIASAVL